MAVVDCSSTIGTLYCSLTANVTGDPGLSLLALLCFLGSLGAVFKLPLEIDLLIIFPLIMVGVLMSSAIIPALGAVVFYLAILLLKAMFL